MLVPIEIHPKGINYVETMNIGEYLRAKRKLYNLSQIELAERAGVGIRFVRELSATPGIRLGQLEKAKEIHRLGVDRYKEKYKALFMEKKITKKQWETIRNFARSWPEEKMRYIEEVTAYESEFRGILVDGFQIGSINYQKDKNITT